MHCLFTMTWWLSEATLVSNVSARPCVMWGQCLEMSQRLVQLGLVSRVFQQKHKNTKAPMYVLVKRSRRVITEPSYIQTEWLHPFQPLTVKPSKNEGRPHWFPQPLQRSIKLPGASNKLTDHWKFYLRATVLCGGICHPPNFENGLPTV